MKFFIFILLFISLLDANDTPKMVVDLTTSSIAKFEKNILKGIEVQKTHYANNLQELEVAVVIHGNAYKFFVKDIKKSVFKDDIELKKVFQNFKKRIKIMSDTYDVEFLMCRVGMQKRGLRENQIASFVKIIPTSTIGLIDKQNEGFAYIPVAGD